MTILDRAMRDLERAQAVGEQMIYPAYARRLKQRLAAGWKPADKTIYAAIGPRCWSLAAAWSGDASWRAYIAVPNVARVDLAVVHGWPVIFYGRGATDDELTALAANMIRAGAELAIGEIGGRYVSFRGVAI